MSKFAGHMHIEYSGGRRITIRGTFEERPSNITTETITNQDGSLDQIITPRPFGFTVVAKDEGQDWGALMLEENIDATLIETHTGRTYLYTSGHFSGDPSINRLTGEVSGMMFDARHRRQTTA